jgi:NAD(P)-dependent dehydrogenase (short-subunit alcohol dehydrogenase family)
MAGRLEGRAALITGAADGIGYGTARRFAAEGAAVLITDVNVKKGEAAARELREIGGRAEFVYCDVTQREEVIAAVEACAERFGAVDILMNNAYRGPGLARIEAKSDDDFEDGLRICLYAAKWAMETAFPHMRSRGWGRIINVCSLNGVNAHMGTAEYNVGKEALRTYTRSAAREWAGYGICANIICPAAASASFREFEALQPEIAATAATANPMGRMGDPELDIGGVALFLASEDARYITGNTLFADGGAHINGVSWVPELPEA